MPKNSIKCDQCSMLMIQGRACHETGCINSNSRFDVQLQEWIKQRKCFDCGYTVDRDDPCCSAETEFNELESKTNSNRTNHSN